MLSLRSILSRQNQTLGNYLYWRKRAKMLRKLSMTNGFGRKATSY